ncbi:MAG: hypothetical protein CBB79_09910 [Synechococcus sp. TMED19]|nr:MAG: hypothetical protein CBB79_09910 [Synechococcus sp. TMED19]
MHWLENSFGDIHAARLVLPHGSAMDPAHAAGLHQLLAGSLTRGCGALKAAAFAERIETLGGSLRSETNDDRLVLALKCVSTDAEQLLPLLLDMIEQPHLESEQVRLEQDLNLQSLQRMQEDPFAVAHEQLRLLLYGNGSYGHDPLGRRADLVAMKPDAVREAASALSCEAATLVVSGPLNDDLREQVHQRMSCWQQSGGDRPSLSSPPSQRWSGISVDTEQTVLMLGFRTLPIHAPQALALRLLQVHLGVGMSSRLFQSLRETHGLVYDVGAELALRELDSPFIWHLSTSADQALAALDALLREWAQVLQEPLTESCLQLARAKLRGQEALGRQTGAQRAERTALCLSLGLPMDYHQQAMKTIETITADDVQEAARHWLRRPVLSACGPSGSLRTLEAHWSQVLTGQPSAAIAR